MKKFLSLVLALVMTMSLVTISAGAKDFTDSSKINYAEAVDVMAACKVIDGYADGSFNPSATLTRGAAAKIICNLILGPTTAGALVADAAPYKDVPADSTFAGYIAYCQKEGIISGYADGTFKPGATLTGYAFMKMLLGALGYDKAVEGYEGNNWSINVAKRALAVGLDDGLTGDFNGVKPVTREEACLYAFNTLTAPMVEYDNSSSITIGDITITNSSKAKEIETGNKTGLTLGDNDVLEFCEKYFTKLDNATDTDVFGRPATKWTWDGDKIGSYVEKADKIAVVSDSTATVKTVLTDTDYMGYDEDDVKATAVLWENGVKTATRYSAFDEEVTLVKGDIVEVYEDSNDDVQTVVVRQYTIAKISDVDDDLGSTHTKKGATYGIDLEAMNRVTAPSATLYDKYTGNSDKVLNGFDADTYVKGAVLAVALKTGDTDVVLDSYVAETVTGKVTAYKTKSTATIGGTKYNFSGPVKDNLTAFDFDIETNLYLSKEGYVIGSDNVGSEKLEDVYYVLGAYMTTSNMGTTSYYVQAVKLDGTVENIKMESTSVDAIAKKFVKAGTTGTTHYYPYGGTGNVGVTTMAANTLYKVADALYTFTDTDSNGKYVATKYAGADDFAYVVSAVDGDVNNKSTYVKFDSVTAVGYGDGPSTETRKYFTNDTQFLAIKGHGDDLKVTQATGLMKIADNTATVVIYKDEAKEASYVLYIGETINSTASTADLLYLAEKPDVKATVKDGKSAWEATVYYMDGNKAEDLLLVSDYAAGFYKVKSIDDDNVYTLDTKESDGITSAVTSSTTGLDYNVVITETYNNKLTATNYDDISFADALIMDVRGSSDKTNDAYSNDIDSVNTLVAAVKKGAVTADLYVEDGEITFVCVTSMVDKQYDIAAATLVGAPAGTTISTVQTVGEDNDVIDIYVYIPAGVVINAGNDVATLTGTGADNFSAAQTLTQETTTVAQTLHFTAQVAAAEVTALTVTFA